MSFLHSLTCRRCFNRTLAAAVVATPFAAIAGRSANAADKTLTPVPGSPKSVRSHILDTAADALQVKKPIDAMSEYLNGFHFYADDMGRQVEANHFCTHLTEDFHQCVIYEANQPNAKLIGIEYIVSERIFKTLPEEEKKLWHSHQYEVKSGMLVAPGVPNPGEHAFMADLVTTYGKTWHTWQIDRDHDFPFGIPQLMMGFTKDGQVRQSFLDDRDRRFDLSYQNEKKNRADIPTPEIVPGANSWQGGTTMQLQLVEMPVKNLRG
ncbi:OBAP family protein [Gluconacetobacter tumulisoli]|uniref:OBAP family protein n=1 Tax=Gluconacetobacter tumulisoli TaxID=1286189 RepID=A0A7W4KAE2_9PROT|nr:OBAP family protein [Gluconacetobacter tumulisoli]MBB2203293.1 OBAP family protein [Gluconacetobacter tumulisoli]